MKENLIRGLVNILAAYRSEGGSVTNPTEILVPDSLRFLSIYLLGVLKSRALKMLGDIKIDEKFSWILKLLG
jgi:hypothetical protein